MVDDDDHTLLQRYRDGDEAAFTDLVLRYQRPLYNAAFWIVRNPADANDVTQTVFLKLAHQAGDYDPQHKLFSWIYRITVNESLNVLRRRRHEETLDDDDDRPADGDHDPEVRVGAAEVARRIRSVLMRMSTNDRVVLSLRHFSELGYAQIASALDIDIKTVKSRLHEARQRLAAQLQDLRTH